MVITRRQALRNSAFALGGAVVGPQFAKAETAASKPSGEKRASTARSVPSGHRAQRRLLHVPSPLLATNLSEAELK